MMKTTNDMHKIHSKTYVRNSIFGFHLAAVVWPLRIHPSDYVVVALVKQFVTVFFRNPATE